MPKLMVLVSAWILFGLSDHSDNALSIAIGMTSAVLTLAIAEPFWRWVRQGFLTK